ncbi:MULTISPECIES: DUF2382 domain-containing protein [Streptomyces]|uniref:DUF2382 domain-containing protein n=1 Tax=Streptomyces TaxID=1883 RepID=UPI001E3F7052|nr:MULTISPECIES: PRC and DUF2382 domain-containing protein [Streptomyces]UFQ17085.1 PRC and DUF2382 domain-containing protein [Streptomyces huasconensis]WCL86685.1 PRC and DUF2382 domain-containing protein [Streptomyces sp. JCM 35825]
MTQGEAFTNPDALKGLTAYDRTGEKIGSIERVYLDDRTGRPEWVTVKTGLFGMKESFVPLAGARLRGDDLHVTATKEAVKEAPRVDADQHLDPGQEHELYAHYGLARPGAAPGPAPTGTGTAGTQEHPLTGAAAGTGVGAGAGKREFATRAGMGKDEKAREELVRSEERLRIGTEEEEVGHARLRKTVVSENVTTSVPLSHEEVRVVREPIREGERVRGNIGEAETEVTLHAERAVVSKETVPVERVHLETEKVTETREVSDTVRKEQIEYDDDVKGVKGERGGMQGESWRDRKQGPRH